MFYVGTSGWAYPRWKANFYRADLPQSRFLEFYSSRLNAVEVNYTFCGRHALRRTVADRWLTQTRNDFVFAFRGPKPITHFHRHRLRNAEDRVQQFETALMPFRQAHRLGPILLQLPKTFTVDAKTLDGFLRQWPRELRISFEFRHPSWFTDDVYEILRHRGACLCLAERDETTTPEVLTADFVYMRLRKSSYSPAVLRKLVDRIKRLAQYRDVFAFFRQDGDQGPLYAQEISRKLRVAP